MGLRLVTLLILALAVAAQNAQAQASISVQIVTAGGTPGDFGTDYQLGGLSNYDYRYGTDFMIQVSYQGLDGESLSVSLQAPESAYVLAWRVVGSTADNAFGLSLGADVSGLIGSASGLYYRNDGTLRSAPGEATRYEIGAKSTPAAADDLLLQVTLTATLY